MDAVEKLAECVCTWTHTGSCAAAQAALTLVISETLKMMKPDKNKAVDVCRVGSYLLWGDGETFARVPSRQRTCRLAQHVAAAAKLQDPSTSSANRGLWHTTAPLVGLLPVTYHRYLRLDGLCTPHVVYAPLQHGRGHVTAVPVKAQGSRGAVRPLPHPVYQPPVFACAYASHVDLCECWGTLTTRV